jgi:signal transduction histidine kinase
MMPAVSGPEICQSLRQSPPVRPVYLILLTFKAGSDDIAAGLEAGADDYLIKPCEPIELRARLRVGLRMLDLQEALLQRVEQMNRFLGIAAHDLRNPLGCIKSYSSLLLDPSLAGNLNPKQEKFVTAIGTSSNFMLRLVETFLGTSAIQEGQLILNLDEEDLVALVSENLEVNRILAERKGVSVALDVQAHPPRVRVDRDKFEQVMNNVVSNAIKYSNTGSTVRVTLAESSDHREAIVEVQDEGCGIPADDIPKLFRPYSRVGARPTGGERSTGLGLFIARRVVEGHGGRIWVESQIERGSTFFIALPLP